MKQKTMKKSTKKNNTAVEVLDQVFKEEAPAIEALKKKSRTMTIAESKLGVTIVLNKNECESLGISENTMTREAVRRVRELLGLGKRTRKED